MYRKIKMALLVLNMFFINCFALSCEVLDDVVVEYYKEYGDSNGFFLCVSNIPKGYGLIIKDGNGNELDRAEGDAFVFYDSYIYQLDFEDGIDCVVDFYKLDNNGNILQKEIDSGEKIITKEVKTEKYNPYSETEECLGKNDLDVCSYFSDKNSKLTEEEFKKELKKEEAVSKIGKKVNDSKDYVLKDYIFFIVPFLIVSVVVVGIYLFYKRRQKNEEE